MCGNAIVHLRRVQVRALALVFRHYRVRGELDGGLDSRPVIKPLFRGFLKDLDFRSSVPLMWKTAESRAV